MASYSRVSKLADGKRQLTVQRAPRQIKISDIVTELANVCRQREARLVATKVDVATSVYYHADHFEREFT